MRKILVIGIGAGNPDHVTVQAIDALNAVDVVFIPDKGQEKAALRALRMTICARFVRGDRHRFVEVQVPPRAATDDYRRDVDDWHARIAVTYARLFRDELAEGQCGGLLVWGDPGLYDSTLRIIEAVRATGLALDCEVIPGISSAQALAAAHAIALNRIGEPVTITTGRKLAEAGRAEADSVVMLDGQQAFLGIEDDGLDIVWGAYLGMDDEILVAGKLAEVKDEIAAKREAARRAHGWIMDTYLLRRAKRD
jgi:precorrin-6A synthase